MANAALPGAAIHGASGLRDKPIGAA